MSSAPKDLLLVVTILVCTVALTQCSDTKYEAYKRGQADAFNKQHTGFECVLRKKGS